MKTETMKVTTKDGQEKTGEVLVPESLAELLPLMGGERTLFMYGLRLYLAKCRRQLATGAKPRRKILRLDLNAITPEHRALLASAGLIPAQA